MQVFLNIGFVNNIIQLIDTTSINKRLKNYCKKRMNNVLKFLLIYFSLSYLADKFKKVVALNRERNEELERFGENTRKGQVSTVVCDPDK